MDYTKRSTQQERLVSGVQAQDAGLRSFMQQVYNYMALALAVTGLVAYGVSSSPAALSALYQVTPAGQLAGMTGLGWIVALAPIGFVMALSAGLQRFSMQTLQMLFWVYAVTMGLSLSSIFILYTGESVARVFFISASVFGGMSIYGHTTKRDLTSMGSFLMMGLLGIVLVSLVNLVLLKSAGVQFATSLLGLLVFIGLTAYNTQNIKSMYYQISGAPDLMGRFALHAALSLYLDFINIFLYMLRFLGDRRE